MMMYSETAHKIKHRKAPNNEFMTPEKLARKLIGLVPLEANDVVLDPAPGSGAFYNNFPGNVKRRFNTEANLYLIYDRVNAVDWIITNPPYSNLDAWFTQSCQVCRKGFAYLLGFTNITPRRIEIANKAGFGLVSIHLCKVFEWFGISSFVIFQKGKENIVSYDRVVWRKEEI